MMKKSAEFEDNLQETFKKHEKFTSSILCGVSINRNDDDLTILYANSLFYQIYGYDSREDALAHGITTARMLCPPLKWPEGREQLRQLTLKGDFAKFNIEFYGISKDGRRLTLLACCGYSPDEDYFSLSIMDITERKAIEEALRLKREDYDAAIRLSGKKFFRYDVKSKSNMYYFDSMSLFGLPQKLENVPEAQVSRGVIAPEVIDAARQFYRAIDSGKPSCQACLRMRRILDGKFAWFDMSCQTMFDQSGQPLYALVALEDVTVQREAEAIYAMHRRKFTNIDNKRASVYEFDITTGLSESVPVECPGGVFDNWDRLVDFSLQENIFAADRDRYRQFASRERLIASFYMGKNEQSLDFRALIADGSLAWHRITISMFEDPFTHHIKAIGSSEFLDQALSARLDDKAEREENLRQMEHYRRAYEDLSSTVLYGICKYRNDSNLSIIFANNLFYEMHGYASQEDAAAAGFTNVLAIFPEKIRPAVMENYKKLVENHTKRFDAEYPMVNTKGELRWLLCCTGYDAVKDQFNVSLLDITERKKTEEALLVSEKECQIAVRLSERQVYIYAQCSRSIIRRFNTANLIDLPTNIPDMPDVVLQGDMINEQSRGDFRTFFQNVDRGDPSGSCELRVNTPQKGGSMWIRCEFSAIFPKPETLGKSEGRTVSWENTSPAPICAVLAFHDVTKQKEDELASQIHRQSILAMPVDKTSYYEFNLTRDICEFMSGDLAKSMAERCELKWNTLMENTISLFIHPDDRAKMRNFLYSKNLIEAFRRGQTELSMNYRFVDKHSRELWYKVSISMGSDRYLGDVKAYCLFQELNSSEAQVLKLKQYVKDMEQEMERNKVKLMMSQMQPHFLYNSLSAIRSIVKVNPDYAYTLLTDFATHLRGTVKTLSDDALIPFEEELKNIKAYLNIEQMRQGERLKIIYDIEASDFQVAPLSIQPFTENAVRHGIFPRGKVGGTLKVCTRELPDCWTVEIIDNGVGFNLDKTLSERTDSAIGNVAYRLSSLMHAQLNIDSVPGKGTTVKITIFKDSDASDINSFPFYRQ